MHGRSSNCSEKQECIYPNPANDKEAVINISLRGVGHSRMMSDIHTFAEFVSGFLSFHAPCDLSKAVSRLSVGAPGMAAWMLDIPDIPLLTFWAEYLSDIVSDDPYLWTIWWGCNMLIFWGNNGTSGWHLDKEKSSHYDHLYRLYPIWSQTLDA